jgi:hypothetical protein
MEFLPGNGENLTQDGTRCQGYTNIYLGKIVLMKKRRITNSCIIPISFTILVLLNLGIEVVITLTKPYSSSILIKQLGQDGEIQSGDVLGEELAKKSNIFGNLGKIQDKLYKQREYKQHH